MARKNTRVVMNRQNANKVTLAIADGMLAVAREVIETARPPDRTPYGEGLVDRGGAIEWSDGKKVGDWSLDGTTVKKPRAVRVPRQGAYAVGGFGFPGRFQEFGTVNHGAQPFLTPAFNEVAPRAVEVASAVVRERMP